MTNNCVFDCRIAGSKDAVDAVINYIKEHSYTWHKLYSYIESTAGQYEKDVMIQGDVKTSVLHAWNLLRLDGIESILNIPGEWSLEVYSEESLHGFSEHIIFVNGLIVFNECRHYAEGHDEESNTDYQIGGYSVFEFDFKTDKSIPEH